ncbi:MAG: hypothetical protein M8844_00675 [marine benthic group bacterium]|nr:hypothetical protein [Gemmatimonadota bacterium]
MKSQKTGGTSLELALSRYCGPEDVITPLNEKHERQRRELGGLGPRNCAREIELLGYEF